MLDLQNVTKTFGSVVANDGINLKVHKGEIHAILGENGAGKSTLMNVLYGLLQPTSGQIFINLLVAGHIVVCHIISGSFSPRPLERWSVYFAPLKPETIFCFSLSS